VVLYFAADLLWATRIKATADALSIPCRPARNLDTLRARMADSDVRGLIVDLDAPEVALSLVAALRGEGDRAALDPAKAVRIVAFGPHVESELLEKARQTGADVVLARGVFDRRLQEILRELEAG
jgi:hypothetical protein